MKLFWKLFCSIVGITVLSLAVDGFVLIDVQFRASLEQEVQSLYEENDMLRYALSMETDGRTLPGREDLAQLAQGVSLTTGGRTISFRFSADDGEELGGNNGMPPDLGPYPLISGLSENQRGWTLRRVAEGAYYVHGASALTLPDETVYLENCRYVSHLFTQREQQYQRFSYKLLAMAAQGNYTEGSLDSVIGQISADPKIQATLRKKLKGRWDKDKAMLMKVAGLPEQEASDWAYLAAEVINWEWLTQVLQAAGWTGIPQEAIDIIRAAVIVEETIKVGIEAEAPRA